MSRLLEIFEDQDEGVLEFALKGFGIGGEVRRQVALVELHAFHPLDLGVERTAFFDGDDAVFADLFKSLGKLLADLGVVVGGDGANLLDLGRTLDGLRLLLQVSDDGFDGGFDAALQLDRVRAGGDVAQAFFKDRLGEHGGGGGAIARDISSLRADLTDQLRADVLVLVLELDLASHRDTVLGHGRGAEGLLDDDVAATRTEGDLDGSGEFLDTLADVLASLLVEGNLLNSHVSVPGCEARD